MKAKRQSLEKLNSVIEDIRNDSTRMLIRNAFSSACYFAVIGEHQASQKMLSKIFNHLGWDRRKTYFHDIKQSMPEFAMEYARDIQANLEFNKLFYKFEQQMQPFNAQHQQ